MRCGHRRRAASMSSSLTQKHTFRFNAPIEISFHVQHSGSTSINTRAKPTRPWVLHHPIPIIGTHARTSKGIHTIHVIDEYARKVDAFLRTIQIVDKTHNNIQGHTQYTNTVHKNKHKARTHTKHSSSTDRDTNTIPRNKREFCVTGYSSATKTKNTVLTHTIQRTKPYCWFTGQRDHKAE